MPKIDTEDLRYRRVTRMSQLISSKGSRPTQVTFFNSEFDTNYLFSLYGDDYHYVQEILDTVLNDFQSLTDNI